MTLKNLYLGLKDQMPLLRLLRNLRTGNVLGLFYKRSHVNANGNLKVKYRTKASAEKAAAAMERKKGIHFSNYKCIFCDGYHLGRNQDNKGE